MTFFLPLLLTVVAVNAFVDPAFVFANRKYARQIAEIMLQGFNAYGVENYNDRLVQKYFITNRKIFFNTVVIGSSRSLQIGNFSHAEKIYNASVSAASLEDYIAIYQLFRSANKLPKKIILGVDPWVLNANNPQEAWTILSPEYSELLKKMHIANSGGMFLQGSTFFSEIISPQYFKYSINYLVDYYKKNRKLPVTSSDIYATPKLYGDKNIKLANGTISYNAKFRTKTIKEVNDDAISYSKQEPIYSLGNFLKLDTKRAYLFEKFVELVISDGVEMVLFLPPYHPIVYEKISRDAKYRTVIDAEVYYRNYAGERGIKIIGSYNPAGCSLNEDMFYDGMHPKPEAVKLIFDKELDRC